MTAYDSKVGCLTRVHRRTPFGIIRSEHRKHDHHHPSHPSKLRGKKYLELNPHYLPLCHEIKEVTVLNFDLPSAVVRQPTLLFWWRGLLGASLTNTTWLSVTIRGHARTDERDACQWALCVFVFLHSPSPTGERHGKRGSCRSQSHQCRCRGQSCWRVRKGRSR